MDVAADAPNGMRIGRASSPRALVVTLLLASAVPALTDGGDEAFDAAPTTLPGPVAAAATPAFVAGEVCLAGTGPGALNRLFDTEPGGVIGADYQRAFPLPDGRVLWLFQDGAVRVGGGRIAIVHNIAMLQEDNCFDVLYGGTRADPAPFLFASATIPFERWYWALDAELGSDGRLHIFVAQMNERGDEYLTHVVPTATKVALFDPATSTVVAERAAPDGSARLHGWSITSDERWTYLYAQCYRQFGFDEYALVKAFDRACSPRITVPTRRPAPVLGRIHVAAGSRSRSGRRAHGRPSDQCRPDRVDRHPVRVGQQGG